MGNLSIFFFQNKTTKIVKLHKLVYRLFNRLPNRIAYKLFNIPVHRLVVPLTIKVDQYLVYLKTYFKCYLKGHRSQ